MLRKMRHEKGGKLMKELTENTFNSNTPIIWLKYYKPECVNLVMTAPPDFTMTGAEAYYDDTSYNWKSFHEYMTDMEIVFTQAYIMLKNYHYCAVIVGDQTTLVGEHYLHDRKFPLAAYFTVMLEKIGFTYITDCIWDKGAYSQPYHETEPRYPLTISPKHCYDHILIFQKQTHRQEPVPCPYCGETKFVSRHGFNVLGEQRWKCGNPDCTGKTESIKAVVFLESRIERGKRKSDENVIPQYLLEKWHRDIVKVKPSFTDSESVRKRQRYISPEAAKMLMMYYSGVGDFVLDPFSGIGTTVFTALMLNRKYLCFEKEKADRQCFHDFAKSMKSTVGGELDNINFGYDVR